jgi:hypothetical protein
MPGLGHARRARAGLPRKPDSDWFLSLARIRVSSDANDSAMAEVPSVLPLSTTVTDDWHRHSTIELAVNVDTLRPRHRSSLSTGIVMSILATVIGSSLARQMSLPAPSAQTCC